MIAAGAKTRVAGWGVAFVAAMALMGGAAAIALAAERRPPVLVLDLGEVPPVGMVVAAVAESAPQVMEQAPPVPQEPEPAEELPEASIAEPLPRLAAPAAMTLPAPDVPVSSEVALPPELEKPQEREVAEAVPEVKPKPRPEKKTEKKTEKKPVEQPDPEPARKAAKESTAAPPVASAQKTGKTPKASGMSPAAYAKAVMKKVRSTRKKAGAGKGSVVVGFSIGPDGSLAGVNVLQGSGNAALDQVAVDHIRRAAPFPPPPAEAGRSYSFEFVGK